MKVIPIALLSCLLGIGCGQSGEGPPLVPVEGTVRLDGEPLAGASVIFLPVSEGSGGTEAIQSMGVTDEDGYYVLSGMHAGEGAMAGKHRVTIGKMVTADGDPIPEETKDLAVLGPGGLRDLLPPRYSNMEKTTLRAEVTPEQSKYDFDLHSQPSEEDA